MSLNQFQMLSPSSGKAFLIRKMNERQLRITVLIKNVKFVDIAAVSMLVR